jgi:dynein light chain LC8-type
MAPKKEEKEPEAAAAIALDIKVLQTDMSEEMVADVKEVTAECFGKHKLHKDLASAVKAGFDKKHPPADNKATSGVWHCVVGSDFAVSVTHETHYSCYWSCNNVKLLIWRSKDSPFD